MSKTPFLLAAAAAAAMAAATPALADDGRAPFDGMTEQAISQIITYAGYDAVDIDLKGRMLQQLGGRHHPPLVVQEVGDEPVSERRQGDGHALERRSEEHTSELQSLMRISYAVFSLKKQQTSPNKTA